MSFARPWLLPLLLLLPLWWWWEHHRRPAGANYSDVSLLTRLPRPSPWLRVPYALRGLALACWAIAAAGPRRGGSTVEVRKDQSAQACVGDFDCSFAGSFPLIIL